MHGQQIVKLRKSFFPLCFSECQFYKLCAVLTKKKIKDFSSFSLLTSAIYFISWNYILYLRWNRVSRGWVSSHGGEQSMRVPSVGVCWCRDLNNTGKVPVPATVALPYPLKGHSLQQEQWKHANPRANWYILWKASAGAELVHSIGDMLHWCCEV